MGCLWPNEWMNEGGGTNGAWRGCHCCWCSRRCSLGPHVHIIAAKQLSASPSSHLSVCLPVYPPAWLPICLSASLSPCLSLCLSGPWVLCACASANTCLFRVPVGNLQLSPLAPPVSPCSLPCRAPWFKWYWNWFRLSANYNIPLSVRVSVCVWGHVCVCTRSVLKRVCPLSSSSTQVAEVSNWTQNGRQLARSRFLLVSCSPQCVAEMNSLGPCLSPQGKQAEEKFSQVEKETKCRSILARALSSCCANIINKFPATFRICRAL